MLLAGSVFLNFFAFLIVGISYKYISVKLSQIIACTFSFIALICTGCLFHETIIIGQITQLHLLDWIQVDSLNINWSLHLDSLTFVMLIVVNVVSLLVQIYSVGYMNSSDNIPRYHAFVSLFSFLMLLLVTADNLLQLFVGWEGVGLCSYFLIGYWYKKDSASKAAMKAFIVNRVADLFFILGLIVIYLNFHSLSFANIFGSVAYHADIPLMIFGYSFRLVDVIGVLLFIGCMGKSAQILFHTWLPDAMEGPTPVSALIHAATMVTAGVFLVVRLSPIFEYSPLTLDLITIVGAVTLFFAATIALVVDDIKKIVAYSTCSQLGYMFIACGVSAYPAAMFHLVTHAYFKALLFLAVGSVIHATGGEQNIKKMGGLRAKIPFTYFATLVASLSLSGIFPFSGFFSKDVILEAVFLKGSVSSNIAYYLGMAGVILTAFYSFRLFFRVFHGPITRIKNVHESPKIMLIPMMVLSCVAVFSGMIGEYVLKIMNPDLGFWHYSIYIAPLNNRLMELHDIPQYIKILPMFLASDAVFFVALLYIYKHSLHTKIHSIFAPIHKLLVNKYYFDEFYDWIFVQSFNRLSTFLYQKIDLKYIDGYGPNGVVRFVARISGYVRSFQTGLIYNYAFVMVIGVILASMWYVVKFVL